MSTSRLRKSRKKQLDFIASKRAFLRPYYHAKRFIRGWYLRWPYIRTFGFRYYYDEKYRNNCKNMVMKRKRGKTKNEKTSIRTRITHRDGSGCKHCKVYRVGRMTIDHVIPLADGGTWKIDNLQLLCIDCHEKKSATENKKTLRSKTNLKILKEIKEERRKKKDARAKGARKAVGAMQKDNS